MYIKIDKKIINLLAKSDLNKKDYQLKIINSKNHKRILKPYIKIDKKIRKFYKIEKYKFHQHRSLFLIDKIINNNKIVISNKASFGKKDFKYFIGYRNA